MECIGEIALINYILSKGKNSNILSCSFIIHKYTEEFMIQIELLRNENVKLKSENAMLKKQVEEYKSNKEKVDAQFVELTNLKTKWEKELKNLRKYRKQYEKLIEDVKTVNKIANRKEQLINSLKINGDHKRDGKNI